MKTQNFLFEDMGDSADFAMQEEWDAYERWLAKPLLERLNAEVIDAGCAAANCIARGLYDLGAEESDIEF